MEVVRDLFCRLWTEVGCHLLCINVKTCCHRGTTSLRISNPCFCLLGFCQYGDPAGKTGERFSSAWRGFNDWPDLVYLKYSHEPKTYINLWWYWCDSIYKKICGRWEDSQLRARWPLTGCSRRWKMSQGHRRKRRSGDRLWLAAARKKNSKPWAQPSERISYGSPSLTFCCFCVLLILWSSEPPFWGSAMSQIQHAYRRA